MTETENSAQQPQKAFDPADFQPVELPPPPVGLGGVKEGHGPRLVIKSLILENFKSYVGRHEIGPFHKKFSTVVGPNGSGKSNIIDALLFVFGYRASRMRQKKINKLIHSSEACQDLDEACVTVRFEKIVDTGPGANDFTVVPGSAFDIRRTVFADGSSVYHIDERKATHRDICDTLRSYGIDLDHNRFLILQGEVEQIALMKPKAPTENDDGMLEFLEDIIGTSRFKTVLDTLEERIRVLNHYRSEKLYRVKLVEQEKNALASVKDEALEWIGQSNSLALKRNEFLQKTIQGYVKKETQLNTEKEAINNSKLARETELKKVKSEKKEKDRILAEFTKREEVHRETLDKRKKQFADCEARDAKIQQDIKHAKTKIAKLEKQLATEEKSLEDLKKNAAAKGAGGQEDAESALKKEIARIQQRIKELDKEKAELDEKCQQAIEALRPENEALRAERKKKDGALAKIRKQADEAKAQVKLAQNELDDVRSGQQRETERLSKLTTRLETAKSRLDELKKDTAAATARSKEAKKEHDNLKEEVTQAETKAAKLTETINQERMKIAESRDAQQAAGSRDRVLGFLLDQKKQGTVPGVMGRLGDLGWVDPKYDVAVSTACGYLDHIVVDSAETASTCIDLLRKNNVGVGNFLAKDKVTSKWGDYTRRKAPQTPENVPRLYDLIHVKDNEILPLFYFAVRETLVADNIDQASRVAYGAQRFRVVSLQGQLIEISGTMSGGGNRPSRGRMALSEASTIATGKRRSLDGSEIDIPKIEQAILQAQNELNNLNRRRLEGSERIHALELEMNQCKLKIEKAHSEVASLEKSVPQLEQAAQEQEKAVTAAAPDSKRVAELEAVVERKRQDAEKVADSVGEAQQELAQVEERLSAIGNARVKPMRDRIEHCESEMTRLKDEITTKKSQAKQAEKNLQRTTERVAELREQLDEVREKLKELNDASKALETEAQEALNAHDNAKQELKKIETDKQDMTEAFRKLAADETAAQKEILDWQSQLEELEERIKTNRAGLKRYRKDLAGLVLQPADGGQSEEDAQKQQEQPETTLPTLSEEQLEMIDVEAIAVEIAKLEEELGQKQPNLEAIQEYRRKEKLYLQRAAELEELTECRERQRSQLEAVRRSRLQEFQSGFAVITAHVKEIYHMITTGGDAELEAVDQMDPFSDGISYVVRPPNKSWKNITNLSGGEKTLSSLALIFALHIFRPAPFYIMDEIDAALDARNVGIIALYLTERTSNAQFIVISLRNEMFELADRMIGIYKTQNCSKFVVFDPSATAGLAQLQQTAANSTTAEAGPATEGGDDSQRVHR